MDIVQERLEREYQLELVTSAPTVVYEVARTDGDARCTSTTRPSCRRSNEIEEIREPIIIANILVPPDYVGAVLKLCNDKRGVQKKMLYLGTQVSLQYELPLAEVVLDFFDRLKSVEPRLRLVRLRIQPLRRPRRWSSSTSSSTATRSMRCRSSCTARTPISAAASWSTRCRS